MGRLGLGFCGSAKKGAQSWFHVQMGVKINLSHCRQRAKCCCQKVSKNLSHQGKGTIVFDKREKNWV